MNAWIAALLGGIGIVAALAATVRWTVHTGVRQVRTIVNDVVHREVRDAVNDVVHREVRDIVNDVVHQAVGDLEARMDARFAEVARRFDRVDERFAEVDQRFVLVDHKFDRLDARIDHVAEVLELRLRPLEADMSLVKQHLLGTPAA